MIDLAEREEGRTEVSPGTEWFGRVRINKKLNLSF
jgi:hypothetical protein